MYNLSLARLASPNKGGGEEERRGRGETGRKGKRGERERENNSNL